MPVGKVVWMDEIFLATDESVSTTWKAELQLSSSTF